METHTSDTMETHTSDTMETHTFDSWCQLAMSPDKASRLLAWEILEPLPGHVSGNIMDITAAHGTFRKLRREVLRLQALWPRYMAWHARTGMPTCPLHLHCDGMEFLNRDRKIRDWWADEKVWEILHPAHEQWLSPFIEVLMNAIPYKVDGYVFHARPPHITYPAVAQN